jgi:hypothetical protein
VREIREIVAADDASDPITNAEARNGRRILIALIIAGNAEILRERMRAFSRVAL